MSKVGQVSWNELNTRDVAGAQKYYGKVFGWNFDAMPMGESEYILAKNGDEMVCGIYDMNTLPMLEGVPDHWFTYFEVADINAAVESAEAAGGSIRRPPFEVMGGMKIAIIVDSNGGVFGITEGAD